MCASLSLPSLLPLSLPFHHTHVSHVITCWVGTDKFALWCQREREESTYQYSHPVCGRGKKYVKSGFVFYVCVCAHTQIYLVCLVFLGIIYFCSLLKKGDRGGWRGEKEREREREHSSHSPPPPLLPCGEREREEEKGPFVSLFPRRPEKEEKREEEEKTKEKTRTQNNTKEMWGKGFMFVFVFQCSCTCVMMRSCLLSFFPQTSTGCFS